MPYMTLPPWTCLERGFTANIVFDIFRPQLQCQQCIIIKHIIMSQRILVRFVLPNQRGLKSNCDICNVKFQLLVKQEHQCKRCLRSVCEQCGPERKTVYEGDGSSSLHRCCTVCIKEIEQINSFRSDNKLCFGQDSEFVYDWINKLNKDRKSYDQILNEYSDNITSITNQNTIRFKRQSDAMLAELLDSYNYSLRNFVKVITDDVNKQIFDTKVRNVMVAIYARVKTMPYVPQLIYLAVFFLCFANQAHSYFIITRMIEKIYPQYVRVKKMKKDNLLSSSLKTILQMYRICVDRVDRNQLEVIAQYLETRFPTYVLSFTLNISSMPNSFYIINEMLNTGSCLPFYKGIASMISFCRQEISSYKSFSQVEIPLLRKVTVDKIKNCFIQFEKSDAKFEVSNQVFDSAEHRKLHEKYKQMESLYNKSQKSLSEKETKIKQLLSELSQKKKLFDSQTEKTKQLQLDILKQSHYLPKIESYQQMSDKYQSTMARNSNLQQKCAQLEQMIQKMEKEKMAQDKYRRNWSKLQQDYIQQIVTLRTKNQIMQIQVSAKQIDFNTSFIQRKFQQKNLQTKMLKQEIKNMKSDLEYYKLKVLEKSYSLKYAKDNQKNEKSNANESRQKQFEKHIQNSKQIVQTLTKELEQLKQRNKKNEQKISQLERENSYLQEKIKEIEQISKVIKQIPEEYNYIEAIGQIERLIDKESSNFMKRKILQSIKDSFDRCQKQLRFRTIDCRIKQQKIKNSFLIKLLNPQNLDSLNKLNEGQPDGEDNLFTVLQQINTQKMDPNSNKQCSIM